MEGVWCQVGDASWHWCAQQCTAETASLLLSTSMANFSAWKSPRSPSPLAWTSSSGALWATVRLNDLVEDIIGKLGRFLGICSAFHTHWNCSRHWLFQGHQETREPTASLMSGVFTEVTLCPTLSCGLRLQISNLEPDLETQLSALLASSVFSGPVLDLRCSHQSRYP